MSNAPFTRYEPEGERAPLVFDSPQSGTDIPTHERPSAPREALMT